MFVLRKYCLKIVPAKNPNSGDRRYINVYVEALISLVAMIARDKMVFLSSMLYRLYRYIIHDIDDIDTDT